MRYIIYGAGAVGGVVGSLLFEKGHETVLVARGAHFEAIKSTGLVFQSGGGEIIQRIPVVQHAAELDFRTGDVVLMCVKTQDSAQALADLEAAGAADIRLFCMQNGLENERMACRRFSRVYAVHLTMPVSHMTPGKVQAEAWPVIGTMDIGCYPRGTDHLAQRVADDLAAAGVNAMTSDNIVRWKYGKLLQNLRNSVEARGGEVDTRELRKALVDECFAVFQAANIDYATGEEMSQRRQVQNPLLRQVPAPATPPWRRGRAGGGSGTSTWQSVARGAGSVETDYLNGEVVMLGRLYGVETPLNEAVRRIANRMARERSQPGSGHLRGGGQSKYACAL